MEDSKIPVNALEEGFNWDRDSGFYYRFGELRNP